MLLTEDEKVRILNRIDDPPTCRTVLWEERDTGWVEWCADDEWHWQEEKGLNV
jgi:hypothetical protein